MQPTARKRLGQAAIVLATFLAYIPAIRGGFIWDDDDYVTQNSTLRTAAGLGQMWFQLHANPQYYPLVHTSFWIEYHLWKLHPLGYHAVNVALHAAGALLLWSVLGRLKVPGAWLAAAIFALHPVHVESVAWITERKNVLSAVFYMLAALACLRFFGLDGHPGGARGWRPYAAALVFFICSLLSKTVTCSLPAAILLILWWKRDRLSARDIGPLVPLLLIGAALGLTTAWLEKHQVGAAGRDWMLSSLDRFLLAGRIMCFYLWKLIWPAKLTFIYPRWHIDSAMWWQYLYPAAILGLFTTLWLLRNRIGKGPLAALAFFAITLTPALGFVDVYPMRFSFVADHFQYLASIGPIALCGAVFCACFAKWELVDWRSGGPARARLTSILKPVSAGAILAILGLVTWRQAFIYKDLETLWRTTIGRNSSAWLAHVNLSRLLLDREDFAAADFYCHEAFRLAADEPNASNNLGLLYQEQGRTAEAKQLFLRCLELKPDHATAHANLGRLLVGQGNLDEGGAHLETAVSLAPRDEKMRMHLALALARKGLIEPAISQYLTALGDEASLFATCTGLGQELVNRGYDVAAVRVYRHGLQKGAESSALLNNLAWLQATSRDAQARSGSEGVAHAERALAASADKQDPLLLDTLAAAWAEAGDFQKAIDIATRAGDIAAQSGKKETAEDIGSHLGSYRRHQPWREARQ